MERFKIHPIDYDATPQVTSPLRTNCAIELCKEILKLVQKNDCFIVYDHETGRTLTSSMEKRKKESFDYVRVTK